MRFKSHHHTTLTGSVGGITYSSNTHSTAVGRSKPRPCSSASSLQTLTRSIFSQAVAQWNNLPEDYRAAWEDYARTVAVYQLGGLRPSSGREEFIGGWSLMKHFHLRAPGGVAPGVLPPLFDGRANLLCWTTVPAAPPHSIRLHISNPNPDFIAYFIHRSSALSTSVLRWKGPFLSRNFIAAVLAPNGTHIRTFTGLRPLSRYFTRSRAVSFVGGEGRHRLTNDIILRHTST